MTFKSSRVVALPLNLRRMVYNIQILFKDVSHHCPGTLSFPPNPNSAELSHARCGEEFAKAISTRWPLSTLRGLWCFVMPSSHSLSCKQRSTWTQQQPLCDSMTDVSRLTPRQGQERGIYLCNRLCLVVLHLIICQC